jgi:hypothetical protein
MRFIAPFVALIVALAPALSRAADLSELRLRLVSRLQATGLGVEVGTQVRNAWVAESSFTIAFTSGRSLVAAFVKEARGKEYEPGMVAPRFKGQADVLRHGDLLLIVVGAQADDAGVAVLKDEFLAHATPRALLAASIRVARPEAAGTQESVQLRHWFTRWIESAPDAAALGTYMFTLTAGSDSTAADLGQKFRRKGWRTAITVDEIDGRKSYWVQTLVPDIFGLAALSTHAKEVMSHESSWRKVEYHGWQVAEIGRDGRPAFGRDVGPELP